MIIRESGVIRPKGSDLIFDHPYNDAPMPRQGIRVTFSDLISGVLKDGEQRVLLGCGQDREGPLG